SPTRAFPRPCPGQRLGSPAWSRGGCVGTGIHGLMAARADIEAVLASGFFDLRWYRQRWPGAGSDAKAAVAHFLDEGAAAGGDPGPGFSLRRYLRANPDVAAAGMNPLLHYLAHGRAEGRDVFPVEVSDEAEI